MASFQSSISQFNPYIPELPVDAYVKVGLYKQQQYEQGIQKAENALDSVAGLPVDSKFSPFLQGKLKNLKDQINSSISGDFSDQQMVRHITRMAADITKDPTIKNALLSTQAIQKAQDDLEKARTSGKGYSPSNEWLLKSQIQAWRENPNLNIGFDSGYTPYSDYNKHALDALKALDPSISQLPFKRNEDGTIKYGQDGNPVIDPVMLQQSGLSRDRVMSTLSSALSEGDKRQLQIDGMYSMRDMSGSDLSNLLSRYTQSSLEKIEGLIKQSSNVDTQVSTSNPNYKKQAEETLKSLKQRKQELLNNLSANQELIKRDPETFKGKFYTNSFINQFADAYSYVSNEYKDNPYQKVLESQRDYELNLRKLSLDTQKLQAKYSKENTLKEEGFQTLPGGIPGEAGKPLDPSEQISTYNEALSGSKAAWDNARKAYLSANPGTTDDELGQLVNKYREGYNFAPDKRATISNIAQLQDQYNNRLHLFNRISEEADNNFNPKLKEAFSKIEPLTINGVTYTPDELIQFKHKLDQYTPKLGQNKFQVGYGTISTATPFPASNEKERVLYDYYSNVNPKGVKDRLSSIGDVAENISKEKKQFIADGLAKGSNVFQEEVFGIDANKPELKKDALGMLNNKMIATEPFNTLEDSVDGRHFDRDEVNKMISGSHSANTVINFVRNENTGKNYVVLSNSEVSNDYNYIPFTDKELQQLSPSLVRKGGGISDNIRDAISSGGTFSTNWSKNRDPESAKFKQNYFPLLKNNGRYAVTADVRKAPDSDTYALYYHIFDNENQSEGWKTIPLMNTSFDNISLGSIPNILRNTGVEQIQNLLGQQGN